MNVGNPHDLFFKKIFGEPRVTQDFLKNYFPKEILDCVQLDTLQVEKESFVEETLKESYSDLLFRAEISKKPGFVYFLFEHKSYPDRFAILQLLKYMISIWERARKETGTLPIILPVLIYHGESTWSGEKNLHALFPDAPKNLKAYLPNFSPLFYDFTAIPDADLKGEILNRVAMLTLKYILSDEFSEKLPDIFSLLGALTKDQTGIS